MEHTPGPWNIVNNTIPNSDRIRSNDTMIALCYHGYVIGWDNERIVASDHDGPSMAESKANAKLMSASPDLLEACKIAMEWFNDFVDDKNPWEERPVADLSTIMHEAIRKAE